VFGQPSRMRNKHSTTPDGPASPSPAKQTNGRIKLHHHQALKLCVSIECKQRLGSSSLQHLLDTKSKMSSPNPPPTSSSG